MRRRNPSLPFAAIALNLAIATTAFAADGYYDTWPPPSGNGRLRLQPYVGVNVVTGMAIGADGHIVLVETHADTSADVSVNGVVCVIRLAADGSYDYGFGPAHNGRVCLSDFPSIPSAVSISGHAVAVQPDGKIVLAAQLYENVAASHVSALLLRLNVDGTLDASAAGGAGFRNFQFSSAAGVYLSAPNAIALQQDGKIVVAGIGCSDTAATCNQDFAVARFSNALQFDGAFGTGGTKLVNFDLGGSNADDAFAVRIDSAGRIVLIGTATQANGSTGAAVVRLNGDGALDTTFGGQGRFTSIIDGNIKVVTNGAVDARDRILIAGGDNQGSPFDGFLIARVLADGSGLDTTFGGPSNGYAGAPAGAAIVGFASAISPIAIDDSDAYDVSVQSDGRILVAGDIDALDGSTVVQYFGIARLLPDNGAIDTTFGASGRGVGVFGAISDTASARAIAFAPGNRLTVAGVGADSIDAPTRDAGIARLTNDLIYFSAFEPPVNTSNH